MSPYILSENLSNDHSYFNIHTEINNALQTLKSNGFVHLLEFNILSIV